MGQEKDYTQDIIDNYIAHTPGKYGIPYKDPQPEVPISERVKVPNRSHSKWEEIKKSQIHRLFPTKRRRTELLSFKEPQSFPNINMWEKGEGLFLFGKAGNGKTVYANQLAMDVKKHLWLNYQDKEIKFTSVPSLLSNIQASFNDPDKDGHVILEQQKEPWLLVLDDLGAGASSSDWLLSQLYLLIDSRYIDMKPTIITSNFSLKELADFLGDERIPTRIDRMCGVIAKKHWDE